MIKIIESGTNMIIVEESLEGNCYRRFLLDFSNAKIGNYSATRFSDFTLWKCDFLPIYFKGVSITDIKTRGGIKRCMKCKCTTETTYCKICWNEMY